MPAAQSEELARNKLSFFDTVRMFLVLLPAPVVLTWAILKSPFTPYGKAKSWKRIVADSAIFMTANGMNRRQLRAFFGPTRKAYNDFMKQKDLPQVVEDIGEFGARLLWIGPKHTDRVVLYFHGGAYLLGAFASAPSFWWYMKENLEKRGKPTGIAMLNYTLVPDRTFPTQLTQAVLAIQHLLDSGVQPGNIQLSGDSAGAQLIHQVLSHMLHPVDGVPNLSLDTPLGGAYMMSPWTRLLDPEDKYLQTTNGQGDYLSASCLKYWGNKVLEGVPHSATPYLEANEAPKNWLEGLDKCLKRILITAGSVEVLRDEILKYAITVEKHLKDTTIIVQDNGVHDDPLVDFMLGDTQGQLTPLILNWLDDGFSQTA
ncbi:Alpha/Beta hydrolase protein [Flammula alnicola]|nr:Alpha/Beta hydrolase protein [Flammula alnicola]